MSNTRKPPFLKPPRACSDCWLGRRYNRSRCKRDFAASVRRIGEERTATGGVVHSSLSLETSVGFVSSVMSMICG